MNWMSSAAVLVAIALAAPADSSAQQVPNLTGTWVLQVDKSDFGQAPALQSRTDVIVHQEPRLTIKRSGTSAAGESSVDLFYVIDGNPHKNMVGPSEITSTLRWEGRTLVTVSTLAAGQLTVTDRVSLSQDGKTMTQLRTFSSEGQEASQTLVFSKQ